MRYLLINNYCLFFLCRLFYHSRTTECKPLLANRLLSKFGNIFVSLVKFFIMLDLQVAIQIVISICVGMSYLTFNYPSILKELKKFIYFYSLLAGFVYFLLSLVCYDFLNSVITFSNYIFELILVTFPLFYYSILEYIVKLIEITKDK